MTVRSFTAVAALTVGFATPALAQEGWTSDAPAFRSDRAATVVYGQGPVNSTAPRHAYVSVNTRRMVGNDAVAPVQATRTINVWGARFEVPAY